ncbi:hypothetical protein J7E91_33610 [Streptomyces sp. ISL-99]|uniref:hypothetical protein n=1 Tax=Streptomyces sp. ISL-99 TaxID=2819193 RepID=UPI001BE6BECC|nr:hypothetical protein [Streptomyces sp. ISL-99]MBT2530164.1 hypothetical protein [Streptomyces sp. ISL-99]
MASLTRTEQSKMLNVEVFDVYLDEEEQSALLAAPEKFIREFLEREGHTVNNLLIDTRLLNGEGCPGGSQKLVHSRADDWTFSSHYWQCEPLM